MTPKPARRYNIDASLLSSIVILGAFRTSEAAESDPPAQIKLKGTVRDFREHTNSGGHPDFEVTPSRGFGLYCGNVAAFLDEDGKPVFTGAGRKVTSDFTDDAGRPIAPHLYDRRYADVGGGPAEPCTILADSVGVDAFEVCLVGATYNGDGTSTWTYHVRELPAGKDLSHWNLKLAPGHKVMPGTTPGYDHGVDGSTGFYGIKWDVDDAFTEGDFTVVLDRTYEGASDGEGVLAKGGPKADRGAMYVPTDAVSTGGSPFGGGESLVEDPSLGDDAGTLSVSSTGGVESAETFAQWYRDELGVNLSKSLALTFNRTNSGTYVFDDTLDPDYVDRGGFFPIDGQLFGNSGGSPDHNFHFTFELHAEFTYDASAKQVFEFVGDDDVWVFIDGKLAIDLGGVHAAREQHVDLDRLNLVDGETYTLDFFFAERHRTQSNCRIETNLVLEPANDGAPLLMTLPFD